jgi:excisionase family DNA binding protein
MQHTKKQLYTVRQASDYLGCSASKIYKLIAARKLSYNRTLGGIRFTASELDATIKSVPAILTGGRA